MAEPEAPANTPTPDAAAPPAGVAAQPSAAAAPEAAPASEDELAPRYASSHHRRHRRSFVPLVVGLGVLVGGYVFSVAVGVELKSRDALDCSNCQYGSRLYIPVVGPWLFLPKADGTDGKTLTAVMGVIQGAGLLLTIYGIIKFVSTGADSDRQVRSGPFDLAFTPLPSGGYANMRLRW